MGKRWTAGTQTYEDCDNCGLSYNIAGLLQKDHLDGSCVNAFGKKEDKRTYGADTQADTWRTGRIEVAGVGRESHSASRVVVEAPATPTRTDPVETGWA